jgi:hypothetical protein
MKAALVIMFLLLLIVVTPAFAVMGFLVSQNTAISVSGLLVWVCTYSVNGRNVQVTLEQMCRPTMEFR